MSWQPITMYTIQCDGTTPERCTEVYQVPDKDDDAVPLITALWDQPEFTSWDPMHMRTAGWLRTPDGRDLCPRHTAAAEQLVRASLDGLPFNEEVPRG